VNSGTRPLASVSLDLDNQWSYMKTHGDAGWDAFPSYLDVVVPRVLDFLAKRSLTITFFVVGQDAALDRNREPLAALSAAGHEIGNHSFHHEPWLHRYSREQVDDEIARAEEHIERATGRRPIGFRGPGFSVSPAVLDVLVRRGYRYDASTFPTFIGPLARAYYFMTSKLPADELDKRRALFGTFAQGFRPNRPYLWRTDSGELLEIPVTTMPLFRVPIHVSYLLYLGGASPVLAQAYFRFALTLCRLSGTQPSLLLHPLDFLGCDDTTALSFFPGMGLRHERKLGLVSMALTELARHYELVTMQRHAAAVAARPLRVTTIARARFAQGSPP
jgi:peptidoglycan/xylan/chitin deacetylase (PgdA/CDA1 family)